MVWMCFIGVVVAYIHDEHMGLDLLVAKLHGRIRYSLQLLTYVLILALSYLLAKGAVELTVKNAHWMSSATGLSYAVLYAAGVLLGVLLVILSVGKCIITIGCLIKNDDWKPAAGYDNKTNSEED